VSDSIKNPEVSDDTTDQLDSTTPAVKKRRFSPLLFLAGVLALAISGSVFAGAQPFDWIGALPIGWIAIVGAIVIGAGMVLAPARRK
jgi:hypothetical protein